jgi:hypothetical protein
MNEIKPGQCWIAKLCKIESPVRIETKNADGTFVARSLVNGRKCKIKNFGQLLRHCTDTDVVETAMSIHPNRRTRVTAPPPKEYTVPMRRLKPAVAAVMKSKTPSPIKTLLDAAAFVLKESRQGMTTREIMNEIVKRKLWKTTGATPWATLNAALNRDITANGSQSRFVKKERGKYATR